MKHFSTTTRYRDRLVRVFEDRRNDEGGFVAGAEMLIFGVLAFVMGSLLIINVWNVIDSSLAVSAAAREGARTFTESDPDVAWAQSQARMIEVMNEFGRGDRAVAPSLPAIESYQRCAVVTVTAGYDVALVTIPLFGQFGTMTRVEASHSSRIDTYRSGDFDGTCS